MTRNRQPMDSPGNNERVALVGGPRDGQTFVTSANQPFLWFQVHHELGIVPEAVYASASPIGERRSRYRRTEDGSYAFDGWEPAR